MMLYTIQSAVSVEIGNKIPRLVRREHKNSFRRCCLRQGWVFYEIGMLLTWNEEWFSFSSLIYSATVPLGGIKKNILERPITLQQKLKFCSISDAMLVFCDRQRLMPFGSIANCTLVYWATFLGGDFWMLLVSHKQKEGGLGLYVPWVSYSNEFVYLYVAQRECWYEQFFLNFCRTYINLSYIKG